MQGNLVSQVDNVPVRNSLSGLRLVDTRAGLLDAGNLLDQAALDKYAFVRDAYLQRRQSLIKGSEQDNERMPEERFDLPETAPAGAPAASVPNPR
jgi:phospholipid-binding lipoprotein MlaA